MIWFRWRRRKKHPETPKQYLNNNFTEGSSWHVANTFFCWFLVTGSFCFYWACFQQSKQAGGTSSKGGRSTGVLFIPSSRWRVWLLHACSEVPRPLKFFSSPNPGYFVHFFHHTLQHFPSSVYATPEQRSILLCFEVQCAGDALPSIVAGNWYPDSCEVTVKEPHSYR